MVIWPGDLTSSSPESDSYGAVRREKMTRMRQTIARNMLNSHTTIPQLTNFDDVDVTDLEGLRVATAYPGLVDGFLDGKLIECPLHAGIFDVTTGAGQGPPITCDLQTFPVRLVGDEVQVDLG